MNIVIILKFEFTLSRVNAVTGIQEINVASFAVTICKINCPSLCMSEVSGLWLERAMNASI